MKILIFALLAFSLLSCASKRKEFHGLAPYGMKCKLVKDFSKDIPSMIESEQLTLESGVKITSVGEAGFLRKARFQVGDVIEKVDGKSVKSEEKFKSAFKAMAAECRNFPIDFDRGPGLHLIKIRVIPDSGYQPRKTKKFHPKKKGSR